MIVLYAVVPRGAAEVDGLNVYAGEQVDVLYEIHDSPPGRTTDDVLAFGRKLQRAAGTGPVLPVRYGSVVADMAELGDLVRAREASWAEQLDRLAGQCELIVHLPLAQQPASPPTVTGEESGTQYLRRRAAEVHTRDAVLAGLLQTVGASLRAHRRLTGTGEERVALLVPESDVKDVRGAIEDWGSSTELAVQVSGPWPPFSFCEEPGS